MLIRPAPEQMLVIPVGLLALGSDVVFGNILPVQQIEAYTLQDQNVVRGVARTDTALVLSEGYVQAPVKAVLNSLIASHSSQQIPRLDGQAEHAAAGFHGAPVRLFRLSLNQDQVAQVESYLAGVQVPEIPQRPDQHQPTRLAAAVVTVPGLIEVAVTASEILPIRWSSLRQQSIPFVADRLPMHRLFRSPRPLLGRTIRIWQRKESKTVLQASHATTTNSSWTTMNTLGTPHVWRWSTTSRKSTNPGPPPCPIGTTTDRVTDSNRTKTPTQIYTRDSCPSTPCHTPKTRPARLIRCPQTSHTSSVASTAADKPHSEQEMPSQNLARHLTAAANTFQQGIEQQEKRHSEGIAAYRETVPNPMPLPQPERTILGHPTTSTPEPIGAPSATPKVQHQMPGPKPVSKHTTVIDLFCGVGGLSLGAARAGFNIHGAVDVDPIMIQDHKRNFTNTLHAIQDITTLTGAQLRDRLGLGSNRIDGVIGGPPCQGFSIIGKRKSKDKRNLLFIDFFRLISELQPKFFLAENVPGILHEINRKVRDEALSLVDAHYTILPPLSLIASDFGAPTNRKRVFFIGYKPSEMEPLTTNCFSAVPTTITTLVKDALAGLPVYIDPNWQTADKSWKRVQQPKYGYFESRLHGHIPNGVGDKDALTRLIDKSEASGFLGTAHTSAVIERFTRTENGKYDSISRCFKLDPEGFCPTICAGTGPDRGSYQAVRPIHPTEPRVITPREAARLQGFPDWFQFSPTKWHSFRQIGNSVSPLIAEHLHIIIATALGMIKKEELCDDH